MGMTYKEGAGRENYKAKTGKDLIQTPAYALEPLTNAPAFKYFDCVWECAYGEGYLANALRKEGFEVVSTDIRDGYNFLKCEPRQFYDAIITNPPYQFSEKTSFIKRCIELNKPWALLMKTETVSTKGFINLIKDLTPQIGIIWFSPRVNFKMPNKGWEGTAYFPVAWFTWNMGFEGNKFIYMDYWTKEYREKFEI